MARLSRGGLQFYMLHTLVLIQPSIRLNQASHHLNLFHQSFAVHLIVGFVSARSSPEMRPYAESVKYVSLQY